MKPLKYLTVIILSALLLINDFDVMAEVTHTVEFRVWDMTLNRYKTIRTQEVPDGDPAVYFEPNLVHYEFIKWDKSIISVTEDMVVNAVYEPKEYTVLFEDFDGTILSEEQIPYGSDVEPPQDPIRKDYVFVGWSSDDYQISGDTVYTAIYKLKKDEVVVEEPTDTNDKPIKNIKFELGELIVTFDELINYEVPNDVLNQKIIDAINYLDEYKIKFPTLKKTEYDGVKVLIHEEPLIEAEANDVTLNINLDEVTLTLDHEDLNSILIDELEILSLESKYSDLEMLNQYKVGNMDGKPLDRAIDINLFSDDVESFFTEIDVEYKPKLVGGLFSGYNPSKVSFVTYEDGTYRKIDSTYDEEKQVYKFTIDKNSTIIPMELTVKVVEQPETFDPIQYILDVDRNILYLLGIGLFVLIYGMVYVAEVIKERRF